MWAVLPKPFRSEARFCRLGVSELVSGWVVYVAALEYDYGFEIIAEKTAFASYSMCKEGRMTLIDAFTAGGSVRTSNISPSIG